MGKSLDAWREDFLIAAEQLFVAQGYEPTTVRQIATTAGSHSTVFYRCFIDKEGCHELLLRRHLEGLWARVLRDLRTPLTIESLIAIAREFFLACAADGFVGVLHAHPRNEGGRHWELAAQVNKIAGFAARLVADSERDDWLMQAPYTKGVVALVLAAAFGWCAWQPELEKNVTAEEVADALSYLLLSGAEKRSGAMRALAEDPTLNRGLR